jgi:hypothetical protein
VRNPRKRRRSRAQLNRVDKSWAELDGDQQRDFLARIQEQALHHPYPILASPQQALPRRRRIELRTQAKRITDSVLGNDERGPVHFVSQILDWIVVELGEEPQSRPGRALRQLLGAAWLMLCVLMLTIYAEADRTLIAMKAWSIFYGVLGLLYLGLWAMLVIGFMRERRSWANVVKQ